MIVRINYRASFAKVVGYAFKTDKRPSIVGGNVSARNADGIIAEFSRLAVLNSRCKTPVAHLAFSLPPGETLPASQWALFSEQVAADYGFEQFVAVRHGDTDCEHIHLIGNRIGLDGKAVSTSNDRHRMRALCLRAEKELTLHKTPQRSQQVRVNRDELAEADRLYRKGRSPHPVPRKLLLAEQVKACAWRAKSATEFAKLCNERGIGVRWRRDAAGKVMGVSFAEGDRRVAGSRMGLPARKLISTIYNDGKDTYAHSRGANTRMAPNLGSGLGVHAAAAARKTERPAHRSGADHTRPAHAGTAFKSESGKLAGSPTRTGGNLASYTEQEKYQMIKLTQNTLLRAASDLTDWLDAIDADLDVSTRAMRSRNMERRIL